MEIGLEFSTSSMLVCGFEHSHTLCVLSVFCNQLCTWPLPSGTVTSCTCLCGSLGRRGCRRCTAASLPPSWVWSRTPGSASSPTKRSRRCTQVRPRPLSRRHAPTPSMHITTALPPATCPTRPHIIGTPPSPNTHRNHRQPSKYQVTTCKIKRDTNFFYGHPKLSKWRYPKCIGKHH